MSVQRSVKREMKLMRGRFIVGTHLPTTAVCPAADEERMCTLQGGLGLTCVALGLRLLGSSEQGQTVMPLVESLLRRRPSRDELTNHVCLLDRLKSGQLTPVSKGLSVSRPLGWGLRV